MEARRYELLSVCVGGVIELISTSPSSFLAISLAVFLPASCSFALSISSIGLVVNLPNGDDEELLKRSWATLSNDTVALVRGMLSLKRGVLVSTDHLFIVQKGTDTRFRSRILKIFMQTIFFFFISLDFVVDG